MNSARSAAERRAHGAEVIASGEGGAWDWRPEFIQLTAASLECLGTTLKPETVAALVSPISELRSAVKTWGVPCRGGMQRAEAHCVRVHMPQLRHVLLESMFRLERSFVLQTPRSQLEGGPPLGGWAIV